MAKTKTKYTKLDLSKGAASSSSESLPPIEILPQLVNQHHSDPFEDKDVEAPVNKSFAGLFKTQAKQPVSLLTSPTDQEDVTFEDDELLNVNLCLLRCFAGKFSGFSAVLKLTNSWKADCKVTSHPSGWLVFKFSKLEYINRILYGGPFNCFGRPLLLKVMPKLFMFNDMEITVVPVWARLRDLPLEFWHPKALRKIATKLGTPITCDESTAEHRRISHARVLVEIDATSKPRMSIPITLHNGVFYEQKIEYEHIPKFCCTCKVFGHYSHTCSRVADKGKKVIEPDCKEKEGQSHRGRSRNRARSKSVTRHSKKNSKGPLNGAEPSTEAKSQPSGPSTNKAPAQPASLSSSNAPEMVPQLQEEFPIVAEAVLLSKKPSPSSSSSLPKTSEDSPPMGSAKEDVATVVTKDPGMVAKSPQTVKGTEGQSTSSASHKDVVLAIPANNKQTQRSLRTKSSKHK
ncbi:hypothetical protein C2S52_009970 [Perilla frutescens var. hirtella]|nr:hypothetical protein C2S52_009970 [Perilla frutescens var. hirtella]